MSTFPRLEVGESPSSSLFSTIVISEHHQVFGFIGCVSSHPNVEQNVRNVVRACNAFDDLVDALEHLMLLQPKYEDGQLNLAVIKAGEALAKAESSLVVKGDDKRA